ncbi:MAG: hypothetical protein NTU89_00360 [Candidatus Dependentiae bacterium]|nr:hypothetical protein [Candidatus Dependentiae bacterium]
MNQILSLRLNQDEHLNVFSQTATLETIVCCDLVSMVFQVGDKKVIVNDSFQVKDLDGLKKGLEGVINKKQELYAFGDDDGKKFDDCCQDDHGFDGDDYNDGCQDDDKDFDSFSLAISIDKCDNFSLSVSSFMQRFYNKTIDEQALKSWVAQLDLLHVLTEENEKEKQSRGKGCC